MSFKFFLFKKEFLFGFVFCIITCVCFFVYSVWYFVNLFVNKNIRQEQYEILQEEVTIDITDIQSTSKSENIILQSKEER